MTAIDSAMTSARLTRAKLHVYNVCQDGSLIYLLDPATKDEFGEILTESSQSLHAFPIRFNPYDRKTMEKISWAEDTDILCFVAKKEVDNLGINIERLRRYKEMKYGGKKYDLRYIELYDAFYNDFLYVVIGGKK